jgi:positive regulator of sigma E activity
MQTMLKEYLLNFIVYIFPLLFIISGLNQTVLLFIGLFLTGIISFLMVTIYIAYFIIHHHKNTLVYRRWLLSVNFLVLLVCIFSFIRK